jgi:hypothetical protein
VTDKKNITLPFWQSFHTLLLSAPQNWDKKLDQLSMMRRDGYTRKFHAPCAQVSRMDLWS